MFTDIEGSTRLAGRRPCVAARGARPHRPEVVDGRSGTVFKHTGDGCIAVFADGADAVDAAVEMHGVLVETAFARAGAHSVRRSSVTGTGSA
ncbi:MAG: hypothetical protein R2699_10445 [Acidimicrobiales bacterium]